VEILSVISSTIFLQAGDIEVSWTRSVVNDGRHTIVQECVGGGGREKEKEGKRGGGDRER